MDRLPTEILSLIFQHIALLPSFHPTTALARTSSRFHSIYTFSLRSLLYTHLRYTSTSLNPWKEFRLLALVANLPDLIFNRYRWPEGRQRASGWDDAESSEKDLRVFEQRAWGTHLALLANNYWCLTQTKIQLELLKNIYSTRSYIYAIVATVPPGKLAEGGIDNGTLGENFPETLTSIQLLNDILCNHWSLADEDRHSVTKHTNQSYPHPPLFQYLMSQRPDSEGRCKIDRFFTVFEALVGERFKITTRGYREMRGWQLGSEMIAYLGLRQLWVILCRGMEEELVDEVVRRIPKNSIETGG